MRRGMLDFDLSHMIESIVGQNCPTRINWDNFVQGETVLSQAGRFASYRRRCSRAFFLPGTKLSQEITVGHFWPRRRVFEDIFVIGNVGLRSTGWLACILPDKPAMNVDLFELFNGSVILPVSLKNSITSRYDKFRMSQVHILPGTRIMYLTVYNVSCATPTPCDIWHSTYS